MRAIRWTENSEEHIARHGVTPFEVEEVLYGHPRLRERGRGGTRLVFGATDAGRLLVVVLADADDGRDFVVLGDGRDDGGVPGRVDAARDVTATERRRITGRAQRDGRSGR